MTWRRDDGESHRGCLTVDPWSSQFSSGYDPLYDYERSWSAPHPEWLTSEARRLALELLGAEAIAEADAVVANPRALPELNAQWLADAALAEAWRRVPIVAGPPQGGGSLLARYGVPFELGGVAFSWGGPEHARDTSAHVGLFPSRRVRLGGLKFICAFDGGFVLTIDGRDPQLLDREGLRLDPAERWLELGFTTIGFGQVVAQDVTVFDGQPWVRLHAQVHPLGEARQVFGNNWWALLRAGEGVVARTSASR